MEACKRLKGVLRPGGWRTALLAILAASAALSCASQEIRGRAPFISISGMSLAGDRLSADFEVRNQNDVPMTIDGIDIRVRVNDAELVRENRDFALDIGARSSETVLVEELPDEFSRSLLESLGSGEVKSLAFDLDGRVHTREDGFLAFSHEGYLYPVPGRPGQFRSAVTQSDRLQRGDDF